MYHTLDDGNINNHDLLQDRRTRKSGTRELRGYHEEVSHIRTAFPSNAKSEDRNSILVHF